MEQPWVLLWLLSSLKFFIGFYESEWLNDYALNKPKFYLRYIDDVLAAFDKEQSSLNFLIFLNKNHSNIKFTVEKQVSHSITFLDVLISGISHLSQINLSGFLLNFKSFTTFSFKINLIECLIDRSFKICNN